MGANTFICDVMIGAAVAGLVICMHRHTREVIRRTVIRELAAYELDRLKRAQVEG